MFGVHVSKYNFLEKSDNLLSAMKLMYETYSMQVMQIYTHGPQSSRPVNIDTEDMKKFIQEKKIKLFVHSSYIIDGFWNAIRSENKVKTNLSLEWIKSQYKTSTDIGALGLIIHVNDQTIETINKGIHILYKHLKFSQVKIIFEYKAVKPSLTSFEKSQNINKMFEIIRKLSPENFGICFDTAHLWATGLNVADIETLQTWFSEIKYPELINLFHLNGSSLDTFGKGKDIHIIPFTDHDDIWSKKNHNNTMNIIRNFASKYKIPMIGEFNRGTPQEYHHIISYLVKEII